MYSNQIKYMRAEVPAQKMLLQVIFSIIRAGYFYSTLAQSPVLFFSAFADLFSRSQVWPNGGIEEDRMAPGPATEPIFWHPYKNLTSGRLSEQLSSKTCVHSKPRHQLAKNLMAASSLTEQKQSSPVLQRPVPFIPVHSWDAHQLSLEQSTTACAQSYLPSAAAHALLGRAK